MLSFPKSRFPLALAGLAFAFALPRAEAAIMITFSYDGTDTIATVSGSITLPPTLDANDAPNGGATFMDASNGWLYVHVSGSPSYDSYGGGSNPNSFAIAAPDQWSGTGSFGFSTGVLYTPFDAVPGGTYAPEGTFTWSNRTLEQVGVAGITTPTAVYQASNGEQILYVTVPEPGLPGLAACGAIFAALGIRRRGR